MPGGGGSGEVASQGGQPARGTQPVGGWGGVLHEDADVTA